MIRKSSTCLEHKHVTHCFEDFSRLLSSSVSSLGSATCKTSGQSREGVIDRASIPQQLSSQGDARLHSGIKMLNSHTPLQRERECPETFARQILHTTQQLHSQDFVLWQLNNAFTFTLSCLSWYKTTAKHAGLHCS